MRQLMIAACAATMLFACNDEKAADAKVASATTTAPEDKKEEPQMDSATVAKNYEMYATPSEAHKMLARDNGEWSTEMSYPAGPGGEMMTEKGTMIQKMVLGGRYQQGIFKGTMMKQPFEGISTTGFDNHKKVYQSSWIDNMGTGIMNLEGPLDATTKTITLRGKMMDAAAGKEMDVKETYQVIDDNYHIMEMYRVGTDGKDEKMFTLKMNRKRK